MPRSSNDCVGVMQGNGTKVERRVRDRAATHELLLQAISRLKVSGAKLSISAVAREVGVHPSLIHNSYADIAEMLRRSGRAVCRAANEADANQFKDLQQRNVDLIAEVRSLRYAVQQLASINLELVRELSALRTAAEGKVTMLTSRDNAAV
jgi:hypothetical protein